ncbi:ethylbenzene dehydrogenase [Vibrio crassostreae]|uniref:ethylbenzene dehydrogenase-related protein n=2 Tax=Vibrionaceae TaxID=641 RepID=UPI00104AD626|nr:ethylbenzene dehydrogenase-related protein [Vibrio crassostreae]MEC7308925.1 ethylbenzene dehydrogenase-related protein [Vibrio crassostreae]TCW20127.1 ethylbenzene dehydrogenase [Vibrio crassostreae]TWD43160.1 ethylbenzene dehydrogenase [Vibrio crassostreae]CAK1697645.1 Ethylbenzene dehydrogenase [Vibrio crassostreae]CAK1699554.1 Ethylbenzene dehydrogenase [Vibrio crassostreae]
MKYSIITLSTVAVLTIIPVSAVHAKDKILESSKLTSNIVIDGNVDAVWEQAKPLTQKVNKLPYKPNNGYEGIKKTSVEMKSMYDSEYIYFLFTYADPTKSIDRFPWVKQEDGSWKQLKNKDDTGHDNTYYEDKFAVYWDINAEGFSEKGCNAACHRAKKGKNAGRDDKNPARKYTKQEGEFIDMWHWKGVRTAVHNQLDDQYVDSNTDPKQNKGWGRKGDSKTGGGYVNNVKDGQPAYVSDNLTNETLLILDSEKKPFTTDYNKLDRIPGLTGKPFTGSRGDIEVGAIWKAGVWTLEMKRKLVTTGENAETQDVQFNDLSQSYPFGVAVFDNSQINHIYHRGVLNLEFK